MRELRAGGLAIVISSPAQREIGKVVTLVKRLYDGDFFRTPDGFNHGVRQATQTKQWLVYGDVSVYLNGTFSGVSAFSERELMPIDGEDFSHEREKEYCHVYGH